MKKLDWRGVTVVLAAAAAGVVVMATGEVAVFVLCVVLLAGLCVAVSPVCDTHRF